MIKTLTLTFADVSEAEIVAALKAGAATAENPTPTKTQGWNWFEAACKASLRDIVRTRKRADALAAAEASVTVPDVT